MPLEYQEAINEAVRRLIDAYARLAGADCRTPPARHLHIVPPDDP